MTLTIQIQPYMAISNSKKIGIWFFTGALMVFLILVIGGITRLTQSGLSIVEWRPVTGVMPPLSDTDWMIEFDKYRQSPEYQQINAGMSLDQFKFIYFWEYLHRLLARALGIVFIVPFIWFLVKKQITSRQIKQSLILVLLGIIQGFMGWYMVASGLVDIPYVSPYRLTAHLLLAFSIFGTCVWFGIEAYKNKITASESLSMSKESQANLLKWILATFILLTLQISWGALVAGHKAGYIFNTYPLMNGYFIPGNAMDLKPLWYNFVGNPGMVQFIHRTLGIVLLVVSIATGLKITKNINDFRVLQYATYFMLLMGIQVVFGIITLLLRVPVILGVVHQAFAMILFSLLILIWYDVQRMNVISGQAKKSKS